MIRRITTKKSRTVVSFELPPPLYTALVQDAASRGVKSLHQRAKEVVIDYLTHTDTAEVREMVASLDATLAHHGLLLQRLGYSVIVHAAGKDSKQANEWIREHMPISPTRKT